MLARYSLSSRVRLSFLAEEYALSSTLNYDASRNLMITVAVLLISMSRRCYVRSIDGVQCCVEWNWPVTIPLRNTADVVSSGAIQSASRSCQVTLAAVCSRVAGRPLR